jgi:hypothetical protein
MEKLFTDLMCYYHRQLVQLLWRRNQVWLPGWLEAINSNTKSFILNNWTW